MRNSVVNVAFERGLLASVIAQEIDLVHDEHIPLRIIPRIHSRKFRNDFGAVVGQNLVFQGPRWVAVIYNDSIQRLASIMGINPGPRASLA